MVVKYLASEIRVISQTLYCAGLGSYTAHTHTQSTEDKGCGNNHSKIHTSVSFSGMKRTEF